MFAYVSDTNVWVDIFGLSSTYRLRDEKGRFRRAQTVEEELMVLGPLSGRRRRDIEKRLRQRGYTAVDARSGGKVWTKNMEDGNTILIRVDPANTTRNMGYADEVPNAHKEKIPTDKIRNGNYQTADTIFDDNGVVLEKNNIEDIPKAHIPIII